ncbi:MAG: carnitine dehydratase [Massilia sp.]|jgi:alpha-methylacyl-CoA racemase|nr:carnitine dehydratase [Massilia sp.]MDB5952551.1 carnitine dehydratase [Massilia sp.]
MSGPLKGVRIVEMVGIGPGPFCAMMLADMGADVLRIDRKRLANGAGETDFPELNTRFDVLARGRRSAAIDLKAPGGKEAVLKLVESADGLIEGFRPGVMERLGLAPEVCLQRNRALVFGRMTGWGQYGPLAHAAGHDLNYLALTGALHAMGRPDSPPAPPLNLVADFGGGAMMLAFGMVSAILEARTSGKGQVVDAAMTDGAALLSGLLYGNKASGSWNPRRGANLLDGGAHFYDTYTCADGKFIAIAAIEARFYDLLLTLCEIDDPAFRAQMDSAQWPQLKEKLAAVFRTKTRDQWCALMEGTDVCFAPVLDLEEAPQHPHNRAREAFIEIDGVLQPAPAPRFSRTRPEVPRPPAAAGQHTEQALADWGVSEHEITTLKDAGVI